MSALFLGEEGSEEIRGVVESETLLHAPSFWRFEVSNAVWKTRAIPSGKARELVEVIWKFPVYSNETEELASESMALARKYGITFYDSAYIAMARLSGISLWTLDRVQAKSAARAGVHLREAGLL